MVANRVITKLMTAFVVLLLTGTGVFAQRGAGGARLGGGELVCPNIPGLTEEQSRQITDLRTAHLREMQGYRDQIDINRIQYRALMRGDRTDLAAINANIDERSNLRNQMEKKQAAHMQAVRNLLTEEQRVWFDSAPRGGTFGRAGVRQASPGNRGAGLRQAYPGGRGTVGPRDGRGYGRGF